MGEDDAYLKRRELLIDAMRRAHGPVSAREMALELGWSINEVTGKLRSLMTERRADREGRLWVLR